MGTRASLIARRVAVPAATGDDRSMDKVVLVFLGGGIGSVLRYLLQSWLNPPTGEGVAPAWPWGTLAANALGCAAAGALAGLASTRLALDDHARLLLAVGVLGGFTTFSAFAGETIALGGSSIARAGGYVAASNVVGLGLAWGAFAFVRAAAR